MGIQDEHQQAQKRTQEGGEDWRLASQATVSGPAGLLSATLCVAEATRLMVYDAEAAFCYATLLSAPSNVRVLQTRQQRRVIGANVTILDMSSAGGPLRAALTPCTNSARVFIVPGVRAGRIPSPNAPVLLKTRDGELARGMVRPSPLPLRKSKMDPGVPGCITWRSCRGLASQAIFPAGAIDESVHCSSTLNNGHPYVRTKQQELARSARRVCSLSRVSSLLTARATRTDSQTSASSSLWRGIPYALIASRQRRFACRHCFISAGPGRKWIEGERSC